MSDNESDKSKRTIEALEAFNKRHKEINRKLLEGTQETYQSQLADLEAKNEYMKKESAYLNEYNKNLKNSVNELEKKNRLSRERIMYMFGVNKTGLWENTSSPEKNLKAKIILLVEIIGVVASILGIIAFYLDYLRR